MNVEHKEYISFFRDVYPEGYCQHLIAEFERLADSGAGSNRQKSENALPHHKNDYQINLNIKNHNTLAFNGDDLVNVFFNGLQRCYDIYVDRFSVLKTNGKLQGTAMKMQRTSAGGGYHVWHCEQGGSEQSNRALVYMLYLNSLPDGGNGETEFLYQQLRVKPEENTMLLWPAAYTHAHRGNPVYGDVFKYIVTGWFYYD